MFLLKAFHEGRKDVWWFYLRVESYGLDEVGNTEGFLDVGIVGEDLYAEVVIKAEEEVAFVYLGLING